MSDKSTKPEIDEHSGVETTGHEWDGLKELNNPAPRWWLIVWLVCIVVSVGYMVLFPAWPTLTGNTPGVLGWTQYTKLKSEQAEIHAVQSKFIQKLRATPFEEIKNDGALYSFAKAGGEVVFKENCAPCHGTAGSGRKGFPNLNDDDWLFGGSLEAIYNTVNVGARSSDPDTHQTQMPAFGKDGVLTKPQIDLVATYVMGLSKGAPAQPDANWIEADTLFTTNCVSCHGVGGIGNQDMGAPRLNDAIWLYGGDKATIVQSITYSRAGAMPQWKQRLSEDERREVALYVHGLGGGQ